MMRAALVLGTLGALSACAAPRARPAQFLDVNAPGELVDVEATLVAGLVNVVDFRADWCAACVEVDAALRAAITGDPRIVVRRVDLGDGETAIAGAYRIRGLPHVLIVDRRGAIRYRLIGTEAREAGALARRVADEP